MEAALPCRVQKYAAPLLHGEGGVLLSQRGAVEVVQVVVAAVD